MTPTRDPLPIWLLTSPLVAGLSALGLFLSALLSPEGDGPILCPFLRLTALPCPGCGLTRSVTAMTHLEPLRALELHPFGAIVQLVMVAALLGAMLSLLLGPRWREGLRLRLRPQTARLNALSNTLIVAFILYGLVRLIAVGAGLWAWP